MKLQEYFADRTHVTAAGVLALGFVLASSIAAYTFYSVRTLSNTIVVTGSATRSVQADGAKWTIAINRTAYSSDVASTKSAVAEDSQTIVRFLERNGIASTSISLSPVFADQNYDPSKQGTSYMVRRDIIVDTKEPRLIQKLASSITDVDAGGSIVSAQMPQYYVSTLAEIRVALIADAVKDARARAVQIAQSTGQRVGALQSASSGVVQVMAPHSQGDVSDYGAYDTSTIDKEVMVTTRATFYLK